MSNTEIAPAARSLAPAPLSTESFSRQTPWPEILEPEDPHFAGLLALYTASFPPAEQESPDSLAEWLIASREGRLQPDAYHALLHTNGDSVLGAILFHYLAAARSGFIDYILVHPDWRRRGIASEFLRRMALLLRTDAAACDHGLPLGVYAEVEVEDPAVPQTLDRLQFWRNRGYAPLDFAWRYPSLLDSEAPPELYLVFAHSDGRHWQSVPGTQLRTAVDAIFRAAYLCDPDEPLLPVGNGERQAPPPVRCAAYRCKVTGMMMCW